MPPPLLTKVNRDRWNATRRASQGSSLTLVYGCGVFSALFECAEHVASVVGKRELQDRGDGFIEFIPYIEIPFENMQSVLTQLSKKFSIAIVDIACDSNSTRFCLLWKIDAKGETPPDVTKTIDPFF